MADEGKTETPALKGVVKELCRPASYEAVYHRHWQAAPMPSVDVLAEVVERLRAVLFPGYFGNSEITPESMGWHAGAHLDEVFRSLSEQIRRGKCFVCSREEAGRCQDCAAEARDLALRFLARLPHIREMLAGDVQAAYEGDPAAQSPGETIFCYPSIHAVTNHRIAHELHLLGVAIIPRIISELAHSRTGIDIHPGASIGRRFFIDHGAGVVIGETAVIGDNVRLYQGVTLGAKSFPKDGQGNPIKGIPRHPIVEDDVIIYSGATILGRVRIGQGSVIGGNVWLTHDVPPGAKVVQSRDGEVRPGAGEL
jgi:serine O-acetyltransferase